MTTQEHDIHDRDSPSPRESSLVIQSDAWSLDERPGLTWLKHGDERTVTHDGLGHYYATLNRGDRTFTNSPSESSFAFRPGSLIDVTIDVRSTNASGVHATIIEYAGGVKQQKAYSTSNFAHRIQADTKYVTLAVRVSGPGETRFGDVHITELPPVASYSRTMPVGGARTVSISAESTTLSPEADRAALMRVVLLDADGDAVLPIADLPVHPTMGQYQYIDSDTWPATSSTTITVAVPQQAETVAFLGVAWRKEIDLFFVGDPEITLSHDGDGDVQDLPSVASLMGDFLSRIPDDEDLIVLHTTAPDLHHPTLALRPNRLTREYLKKGAWVVFFPFSSVTPGAEIVGSHCIQLSRSQMSEFLAAATRRRTGGRNVFICSSFPDVVAVGAMDLVRIHGWRTVYEVRDDMEEFNRVGYSKWFHPQLETQVARTVDQVISVSPRLAAKMALLRGSTTGVTVVPNAVDGDFVKSAEGNRSLTAYRERSQSTTVGYIGHLTPSWFDWQLLLSTAADLPGVTFEIIGHGAPVMDLPPNVLLLGPRTHDEFLVIAQGWKAGLIPFKPSTLTFAVDPNKIYEYLAAGLRTVTAQMGSVDLCPSTYVYDSRDMFHETLIAALEGPFERDEIDAIEEFLVDSTWESRSTSMLSLMGL